MLISSFIIPLQQQQQKNQNKLENLRKKINTQEKDGEGCYILFPTLPLYKHSKLVQVTRAHSHPTMAFMCQIGVLWDKGCNKTKILFDQIMYFWKCPAIGDSISHHPPFAFRSNSDSSHKHSEHLMIYRRKQTLVLPDCSTLKSRNNHVSAQDQSSDRQVKAPFYYVQTQFILGEVKTMISSLNSYFN